MTKILSQEEAEKLINTSMAESTISGISRLLVKAGTPVGDLVDSLLKIAAGYAVMEPNKRFEKFLRKIKEGAERDKQ